MHIWHRWEDEMGHPSTNHHIKPEPLGEALVRRRVISLYISDSRRNQRCRRQ